MVGQPIFLGERHDRSDRPGGQSKFEGMIPEPLDLSDDKYAAVQDAYYILEGFVRAVDDRTYVEAEYRSDVEDPLLK